MTSAAPKFSLSISLNALEHLGINLYSNVPSVLSEVVANAWDADAETVHIKWDDNMDKIVIHDTGIGMTEEGVNNRFLKVGYRRRDGEPGPTAKGRPPMGRKGIGKLSLFSIADCVEIETVKDGEKSAFRMRLPDIRAQIESESGAAIYLPEVLPTNNIDFEHGTRITLTEIRKKQTIRTVKALKKRLARRFSIIGESYGFQVFVEDEEVTPADRDYYEKIQYLWSYGNQDEVISLCTNALVFDRTNAVAAAPVKISGWLGTVKEAKNLRDEEGDNLNKIAIFVRGKLAQEDMLSDFSERGVYASYLIGEIRVDDLDTYDGTAATRDDDAATSSRQKIVEDDTRYQAVMMAIGAELKHIQNEWQVLRTEEGATKALEIPAVNEWMSSLPNKSTQAKARKWLGKINRIRLDDAAEQKQLIKHAVLAFEFYRIKENLEALDNIDEAGLPVALEIFGELDNLEASLYGQIVQTRIKAIVTLEDKVDANAREKAIQTYLFNHLWLLDPSWERAEGSEIMERPVKAMFADVDATLTADEKKGRLDIAYRRTAGEHVIIELKRPERIVTTAELVEQVGKYLGGMQALLDAQGKPHEPIEIVIILGATPSDWTSDKKRASSIGALRHYNARVMFYENLLRNAREAYQEYLRVKSGQDKLAQIIKAIDDYAPQAAPQPALAITAAAE